MGGRYDVIPVKAGIQFFKLISAIGYLLTSE
jgi:hypothetical protein